MGSYTLEKLIRDTFQEALDIGSNNWDSYLEGNRWPELEESDNYQRLRKIILDIP